MKQLILKVKDKTKVHSLEDFCSIIYVSKFTNVVGVEIHTKNLKKLEQDTNIISYRESEVGNFQSQPLTI